MASKLAAINTPSATNPPPTKDKIEDVERIYKSIITPELYIPEIREPEEIPGSIQDYFAALNSEGWFFNLSTLPTFEVLALTGDAIPRFDAILQASGSTYLNYGAERFDDLQQGLYLFEAKSFAKPESNSILGDYSLLTDDRFRPAAIDELVRLVEEHGESVEDLALLQERIFRRRVTTKSLLALMKRLIGAIRKSVFQTDRIFCGMSRSNRIWFLLHGSHPPKNPPSPNGLVLAGGACT